MDDLRRKVMAGAQVRRLRAGLGLSQAAMAAELGISTSYLNLVERNQRPLTAQLLIRLSETYAVDPHAFSGTEDAQAAAEVEEILSEPFLRTLAVPRAEVRAALEQAPTLVAALRRLHAAWAGLAEAEEGPLGERGDAARAGAAGEAVERVRAVLERAGNHFAGLEAAAEGIAEGIAADRPLGLLAACARRLREAHGTRVEVLPAERMGVTLRHHDRHRRKLMLSDALDPPGRAFQAAVQLVLTEAGGALAEALREAGLDEPATRALGRVTLANYAAAAVMMPYGEVLAAAQDLSWDMERVAARFGASWEQVAHRLTTLGRPGARGLPLFMLRVDRAGNVSKRFSGGGAFPFARAGGTCPRWAIHAAFEAPGRVIAQKVELPDGKVFLTWARRVRRVALPYGEPEADFAVAMGCEWRHAGAVCYAAGLRPEPVGIGVSCRLCDRPACPSRAAPSLSAPLAVAEGTRGLSPFGT